MYNERFSYRKGLSEVEGGATLCPRCGSSLECSRSHEGLRLYCSSCGYSFDEEDRPMMSFGGV